MNHLVIANPTPKKLLIKIALTRISFRLTNNHFIIIISQKTARNKISQKMSSKIEQNPINPIDKILFKPKRNNQKQSRNPHRNRIRQYMTCQCNHIMRFILSLPASLKHKICKSMNRHKTGNTGSKHKKTTIHINYSPFSQYILRTFLLLLRKKNNIQYYERQIQYRRYLSSHSFPAKLRIPYPQYQKDSDQILNQKPTSRQFLSIDERMSI